MMQLSMEKIKKHHPNNPNCSVMRARQKCLKYKCLEKCKMDERRIRKNLTRDRAENVRLGILENYHKSAELEGVEASGSAQTHKYSHSKVLLAFN